MGIMSKVCAECGKTFKTVISYQKYCSKDCAKIVDYRHKKNWAKNNPDRVIRQNKLWSSKNKDKISKHQSNWKNKNKVAYRKYQKEYYKEYLKHPVRKLKHRMRVALRAIINKEILGKTKYNDYGRYWKYIGLTNPEQLVNYLIQTYNGPTGNLSILQVDHITPLSTARTITEVKRLFHFSNLRLITPAENKTGRVIRRKK